MLVRGVSGSNNHVEIHINIRLRISRVWVAPLQRHQICVWSARIYHINTAHNLPHFRFFISLFCWSRKSEVEQDASERKWVFEDLMTEPPCANLVHLYTMIGGAFDGPFAGFNKFYSPLSESIGHYIGWY